MQGAREMLAFLLNEIDNNDEFLSIDIKIKKGKKEHFNAIKRLILKDGINVQNYMNKRKIMFRNHERTEKGKLKKSRSIFLLNITKKVGYITKMLYFCIGFRRCI